MNLRANARAFALRASLEDMIMFNSPLHFCKMCRAYVALDQSQGECAREHDCAPPCPLVCFFPVPEASRAGDNPAASWPVGAPLSKPRNQR